MSLRPILLLLCLLGPAAARADSPDALLLQQARELRGALRAECTAAAPPAAAALAEAAAAAAPEAIQAARRSLLQDLAQLPASCEPALRAGLLSLRRAADRHELKWAAQATSWGEAMRSYPDFDFLPGDVLLLRSAAAVSSAVSQIGESPAAYSHAAMIAVDPDWDTLEVVESVVDHGVQIVSLDDWITVSFVRAAVYRHRDRRVAEAASVAAFRDAASREAEARHYDFGLSLDDHARLYCTELVSRAFAIADPQAPPVPARVSNVGALIETFPLAELGARERSVFLPDDLELDPRFEQVLEIRSPQRLPAVDAFDRVFRQLYEALRGPQREATLAAIDREAPQGGTALAALFSGQYEAYSRLPEKARARIAGVARLVASELQRSNVPLPQNSSTTPTAKE